MVGMGLVRVGEHALEVPLGSVSGMRVPGLIYADEELLRLAEEDQAVKQVANVATLPGVVRYSYAMPDIHWGYGFPIGGVAATDVEEGGVISPGGVGFDISCGVRLLRSDLTVEEARYRLQDLVSLLGARIPAGVGGKGLMRLGRQEMARVLKEGVRFPLSRGVGWPEDEEYCEDRGRLPEADPESVSDRAYERGAPQLGSLGAGNHFLEVQVVEEIFHEEAARAFGLFPGQICVMIHTGSRGVGHQTCTDDLKVMDRAMRKYGIEVPDRQLACAPVDSPEGERYLKAMAASANYARANRHVLADAVRRVFEEVFRGSARSLGMYLVYDVAHNLAKIEEHEVDGARRTLCVHRKGATRAFGPGHPELPERYRGVGQPVLIPGSMGTSSYVLAGTGESETLAFSSTCHGAGRTMSRTQAKKRMRGGELREKLRGEGILVHAKDVGLLAEEAPYAYKDVSRVVEVCDAVGLSKKVARLRPLAVVKG